MTRLGVLASLLGVLLSLSVALARQGVVKTRNGQTYEGEVEEKAGVVTVTNRGIQTRIAQSDVASLSYPEDFDKQFAAKLAKLEKGDSRGRIALAREAFNNGRYKLSRDVLEEVLASDPNNAEAAELRDTVMAQIRLERLKQNPATAEARAERPATTQATTMAAENLLKARDINIIRQQEMRLDLSGDAIVEADRNIPIRFEKDANRRYARQASNRPAGQFLALSALDQAREMYRQGPREMRDDIKIMRDPQTMLEYRRTIQPYVIANCATSQCHGGPAGGSLQLITPAESDPATYTNFFVLQSTSKKAPASSGGIFSKGELYMFDRMQPPRSLLLDYSIPRNLAEYDHPEVPNFKPPLRGRDDPRYRLMLNWISNSLRPAPEYGIDYRHKRGPATTQATTEPATQTTVPVPAAGRSIH